MSGERLGCFSPHLTASQKAALRQLQEGLAEGRAELVQEGKAALLLESYRLTEEALQLTRTEPTLDGFQQLRQNDDDDELVEGLKLVLWEEAELTPFAAAWLRWSQDRAVVPQLEMSELNSYLTASLAFYQARQSAKGAGSHPDQPPPQACDLSSLVGELAAGRPEAPEGTVELTLLQVELGATSDLALETASDSPREACEKDESLPFELRLAGEAADPPGGSEVFAKEESSSGAVPELSPPLPRAGGPEPTAPGGDDGSETLDLSAAPLSPLERRSGLVIKKKYLGYGKNTSGVMGYCGQLTLSRYDDEPLEGRLESSNPLLFLTDTVLSGKVCRVAYWMPPAAFPQPGGHLTVRSSGQSKVLSVSSLFPQSRTDFLSGPQVLLMMLAPALLGLLYFSFVYVLSVSAIVAQVREIFPEAYAAASAGSSTASFRAQGVGLYQLEVVPASESLQLIWAALIWFCPLLSAKFFRHLSRSRQRDWGGALAAALLLPSLGLFGLWHAQKLAFPLLDHADFAPLDLRFFWPWGLPLNLLVALYLFLSVHGVWDRRLPSGLRFLLPVALSLLYLTAGFGIIFGRSWLG